MFGDHSGAVELILRVEERCADGAEGARVLRKLLNIKGIKVEAGRKAERVRGRAALKEVRASLEAWETQAGGDRNFLVNLKPDEVEAAALANPSDAFLYSPQAPEHLMYVALYKASPYTDTLLLYSDAQLVATESDTPGAEQVSYLREYLTDRVPGGLYGELGTEGKRGQEGRAGGSASGAGSSRGTGKGKGKSKGKGGKGSSASGTTSSPVTGSSSGGSCSSGSSDARAGVLLRNLELARRWNVLGNRDAAAGMLVQSALW